MTKRNSKRPQGRKSKFFEIDGHRLTEAMHSNYQRCLESRRRTNHGATVEQIERRALDDFLAGYRPSSKLKDQLERIPQEAMDVALAIASLREYAWYGGRTAAVRAGGIDLLKKLAVDLYTASAKLTAIAMNVEAEGSTKLQDWLARDADFARIGSRTEVRHGA